LTRSRRQLSTGRCAAGAVPVSRPARPTRFGSVRPCAERAPEGRRMSSTRCGPSIREFLQYYVLVLLHAKRRTIRELVEEIEARSGENRPFHSGGVLHIPVGEMERVVYGLADRGWVRLRPRDGQWGVTKEGRRARQQMEEQCRDGEDSKRRGASQLVARLKEAPRGSYVLDVGTGEGFLARRLAKRGFRVLGIDSGTFDYSKHSVEKAQQEASLLSKRLEFRRADVTKLSRPGRGFDYVVSSQAVHCMRGQRKCLQAIHRLLKPGGRFLCLDFLVGLEGFLSHGFHCFLAIPREEWEGILPAIGFNDIHTQKVKDYLVVEARKARPHYRGASASPCRG
jgi:ubiquinone/menaquinone biosynthesis C-methylase UbiE